MLWALLLATITANADGTITEKLLIDTDFQDWTKSSTTSTVKTNFSDESITFTYVNTSVDPAATNDNKFDSSKDPAYKGYIMCEKKEATVTTTAFKNITKIRYRHGATGSNRGWGLKIKVGNGSWETINDAVVSSPVWVEKDINKENVELQWYNLNTGQNAYMFELEVYGNVLVTAEQVSLTTKVSPEAAGNVTVKPNSTEFDKGTEVELTAEKHFGYKFKNWTDANGKTVSTKANFTYKLESNATLTANFEAVNTYALTPNADGANDYLIELDPAPVVIDNKYMYEEGQAVQLTATQYEGLVTFNNWEDGTTATSTIVTMDADRQVTALYSQADIIAGWDFYTTGNNGRSADFASEENETAALSLVNTETGATTSWNEKSYLGAGGYESFKGAAVNWTAGSANGDVGHYHWQTKVNATAFSDIIIQFQMLYNYNAYPIYNVEYSLNGTTWTKLGSISMTAAKAVASFKQQLPAECNNQRELYIRMLADKTSTVTGTASKNDGNALAMFFITGNAQLVDDGKAPVLVSTVPSKNAQGVSSNGKIILTFDEKVKTANGVFGLLADQQITPIVSGKTVGFEYKGLEYATDYTFTLPANCISDLTDNFINEPIALTFTTMNRPAVNKGTFDKVVSTTDELAAAIKAANSRQDKTKRYRIFLKNGIYTLPLSASTTIMSDDGNSYASPITEITASNISFIGESRDGVVITNDLAKAKTYAGEYGTTSVYDGIGKSDVLQLHGSVRGTYFQDLTVKSGIGDALGRNLAVQDKGSQTIYKNVGLYGYQDTWTSNNDYGYYYFEGGYVRGRTDYMCGKGDAFFNAVELRQIAGGYAAVPSKSIKYGYVYKDCTINGEAGTVKYDTNDKRTAAQANNNYTLGRPWGSGTPVALFIDTKMNVLPSAIGWSEMSKGWPKRFAEWNSMTSTGGTVDLSGRKNTFNSSYSNNPVLTAAEAAEVSNLHNMFATIDWDPTLLTEQAPLPKNVQLAGTKLSWDNSDYALCWAIVKNGKVVGFTSEPTYTIDDLTAKYAVRAANEMGGLGDATDATVATGILTLSPQQKNNNTTYNLQGQRVTAGTTSGLYIRNGKKIIIK